MASVIEVNEGEDLFELSHFVHFIMFSLSHKKRVPIFLKLMGIKIIVGILKIFQGVYVFP